MRVNKGALSQGGTVELVGDRCEQVQLWVGEAGRGAWTLGGGGILSPTSHQTEPCTQAARP